MAALRDQIAVITGAGSGIGRAVAQRLAGDGARVLLVGRTLEKLQGTARELPHLERAPEPLLLPADLRVDADLDALCGRIEGEGIDILVLCAGEYAFGPIAEAPVEDFDRLYASNLRMNYRMIQKLLPTLKRRRGQIAIINSSSGLVARPEAGQFAATQHALKGLADALRAEINQDGVRVLTVFSGTTATPRVAALKNAQKLRPELLIQPEDVAAITVSALIVPRTAEVTDITIRPMMKSF
jgi:short-subunit dehydrogenase